MPTGVSVPVRVGSVENGVTTTSLEAVDLYCLDAISLLRFLRLAPDDRKRPEYVVFALLGFTADEYVVADDAIATDDGVR